MRYSDHEQRLMDQRFGEKEDRRNAKCKDRGGSVDHTGACVSCEAEAGVSCRNPALNQ